MTFNKSYLKTIAIIVSIICLIVFFFSFIVMEEMKESEAYKASQTFILNNKPLIDSIGDIKSYGFFVGGVIEQSSRGGHAEFEYTVYGAKLRAPIRVELYKDSLDTWKVKHFIIGE